MSRSQQALFALSFLLLCGRPTHAAPQGDRAESTFPFEPFHARAVGLGGAGVALRGAEFSLVNPAASAGERGAELSHRASPTGAQDYAISAGHGGGWGIVRMTIRRRDWGAIAADLGLPDLTVGEQSIGLTIAEQALGRRLAWGVSMARLDADYLGARTGTWGMDVGAQAHMGIGLGIGISLLHVGKGFESDGGRAPLPTRIRPGVAWEGRIGSLQGLVATDLALPLGLDTPPDVHAGTEVGGTWGLIAAAARTAYRSLVNRDGSGSRQGAWSVGGGLRVGRIAADIAYTFGIVFGDERFISLSIRW